MKCLVLSVAILSVSTAEQCSAPELENGVVVAEQNLQQNTFTGTFQLVFPHLSLYFLHLVPVDVTEGLCCMGHGF